MGLIIADGAKARAQCAKLIKAGEVVAFKTDTFYGLGVDPFNAKALRAVNRLKRRVGEKPILVVISDKLQVKKFVALRTSAFDVLTRNHWPGPLTIVAPALAAVPDVLTGGTSTIGVRLPLDRKVRSFIRACGGALTATSANPSGKPPARSAEEVERYFKSGLSCVVDGGPTDELQPSTVVSTAAACPRLIREGSVPRRDLQRSLSQLDLEIL